MLEMDGSVSSPLCPSHPPWQELQGVKAIMPMPGGASRDFRGLSTSRNAGRFLRLDEGQLAWVQKLCSPIGTDGDSGPCCELGQAPCRALGSEASGVPLCHSPNTAPGGGAKSSGRNVCLSRGAMFLYDGVSRDPGTAVADWASAFLR